MRIKTITTLTACLLTIGCNKLNTPDVSCSAENTQTLLISVITNDIVTVAQQEAPAFDASSVNKSLHIEVKNIITDKIDKELNKYECRADVYARLPDGALNIVKSIMNQPEIANNIKVVTNSIETSVTYKSESTDDKSKQFVEAKHHDIFTGVIAGLYTRGMMSTQQTADVKSAINQAVSDQQTSPTQPPSTDDMCTGLDLSITSNQLDCLDRKFKKADDELNARWKVLMASLPADKKSSLKNEQVAWIKEKEDKCAKAGSEFSGGTLETVMIADCNVQMTEERLRYLNNIIVAP